MGSISRTRRRRTVRLGVSLVLAVAVSAVSLNDLQPVQDGVLPVACSLVYHTAIQGCTTADFTKGQSCSLSCIVGIKQIEDDVDDQCKDVKTKSDSLELLDDAQRGNLVLNLCVGNDFTLALTTSTSSIRQTSSTVPPPTPPLLTTPPSTTSHTVGSFSTIPLPTTTPIQTTVQTPPAQSTVTKTTFSFEAPSSSSTSVLTTSQISTTLPESVSLSSASTTSTIAEATSISTSPTQTAAGRGGGSPFDATSGSTKLSIQLSLCVVVGAVAANLRLPQH